MSDLNKNILITPNKGQASDPIITFTGKNNTNIFLKVLDDGTVSFEGSDCQLLGITDTANGALLVIKNKAGVPALEISDSGLIKLAEYANNILIGTGTDNTIDKLQINGTVSMTGINLSGDLRSSSLTNIIDGFTINGGIY